MLSSVRIRASVSGNWERVHERDEVNNSSLGRGGGGGEGGGRNPIFVSVQVLIRQKVVLLNQIFRNESI